MIRTIQKKLILNKKTIQEMFPRNILSYSFNNSRNDKNNSRSFEQILIKKQFNNHFLKTSFMTLTIQEMIRTIQLPNPAISIQDIFIPYNNDSRNDKNNSVTYGYQSQFNIQFKNEYISKIKIDDLQFED